MLSKPNSRALALSWSFAQDILLSGPDSHLTIMSKFYYCLEMDFNNESISRKVAFSCHHIHLLIHSGMMLFFEDSIRSSVRSNKVNKVITYKI